MKTNDEPAPLCASCGGSMSPRDNNRWFCPSCAEYGEYVGMINPDSPEHPGFYQECQRNRFQAKELLVGKDVEFSDYGTKDTEYLGTINTFRQLGTAGSKKAVVDIIREPAEPFYSQQTTVTLDDLMDWWKRPSIGRNVEPVPEKEAILYVI